MRILFLAMVVVGSWGQAPTQTEAPKPPAPAAPTAVTLGFAPSVPAQALTVEIADLVVSDDGQTLKVRARSTNPLDPRLVYFRLGDKSDVLKDWTADQKPAGGWKQMSAADGLFVGDLALSGLNAGEYPIVVFLAPKDGTDFVFSESGQFKVAAK